MGCENILPHFYGARDFFSDNPDIVISFDSAQISQFLNNSFGNLTLHVAQSLLNPILIFTLGNPVFPVYAFACASDLEELYLCFYVTLAESVPILVTSI